MELKLTLLAFVALTQVVTCDMTVDYPARLPRPNRMYLDFFVPALHYGPISKHEASVVMYQLHRVDEVLWNCIAAHSDKYLDGSGDAPLVRVPANHDRSRRARAMCMIHAITVILPELIIDGVGSYREHVLAHGVDPDINDECDQVQECDGDSTCLNSVAASNEYSPKIMGAIVGEVLLIHSRSDGWNANGATDKDGQQCTANCVRYGDTTNWKVKNSPWSDDAATKDNWQPLLENDGNGFFFRQMHVTPHVGFTGEPRLMSKEQLVAREAPPPNYNYDIEAALAIERVRVLDDWHKIAVELLDNKIRLMIELHVRLRKQFQWTLEESIHFQLGYTFSQHDSVLVAWKEKIRYDMVRTTTVIQDKGDQEIEAWAGPYQGVRIIKAKHWQPYIRIMPHAEYPSGSSCICTVIQEFTDKYLLVSKNGATFDPSPIRFHVGSSVVEPGVVPAKQVKIDFTDMVDVRKKCQDSRLWGGQHFTASPPGAEVACKGIGDLGYDYVQTLLAGEEL